MATYTSSILPTEAAYYELYNADITNGILTLASGGSASRVLETSDVAALTEWFNVNIIAEPFTDSYEPWLFMHISAKTINGTCYNYTCTPCAVQSGVYSAELQFEAVEYAEFVVTFRATQECRLTLWELCPESPDANTEVLIDGVKQSLPRLLFDYNTSPVIVGQTEMTIGLITCNLLQNTDIQGHFNLTYTASVATTITLRFKDNGATELFAPLFYDVQAGRGSIGVPHAYLKRLAGYHNFTVTAQVSYGALTLGVRGVLFTIDGGYLAERILDIGANISDVAIEQPATNYRPSTIWVISVEQGELIVRSRVYNAKTAGVKFEPRFSLGPALDGAIEFDGYWSLAEQSLSALYRMNTYENPYCFIVDLDNNLYVQRGADENTRLLLDTDVTSVSACRGYKSELYIEQDQGLIALYVKNGVAWYRQYAYRSSMQTFDWYEAEQVPISGRVVSAYVLRLNDYRVGFNINTTTDNYWLISKRTYVGQAYKPETLHFSARSHSTVGMIPIDANELSVSGVLSEDNTVLTATFNFPIQCIGYDPISFMNLPDGVSRSDIESTEVVDNTVIITFKARILYELEFSFDYTYAWQYRRGNCWIAFSDSMPFSYTIEHPIAYEPETLEFNPVVETEISQMPIVNIYNAYEDTLNFYPDALSDVEQKPISPETNIARDTCTFDVNTLTSTVLLQLVGPKPI